MGSAAEILEELRCAGVEPTLTDDSNLAFPIGVLTDRQRQAIRRYKTEIVSLLRDAANDGELAQDSTSDETRDLAWEYYRHHFRCRLCIAAGQGYGQRCGPGLVLWQAYLSAHQSALKEAD